jgi:hypothetical protein
MHFFAMEELIEYWNILGQVIAVPSWCKYNMKMLHKNTFFYNYKHYSLKSGLL